MTDNISDVLNTVAWLKENGFAKVGKFIEKPTNGSGVGVEFIDVKYVNSDTDWIYIIVFDGDVKYIGETAQTLAKRMRLYYLEARTDSTNSSMRERLKTFLPQGHSFDIYAQKAPVIDYRGRQIKLRVDLEIEFIKELRPEWNKKGVDS